MTDEFGAFMPDVDIHISGAPGGTLSGRTFAAKDVFDVAGYPTSNGNPVWRETHPLPTLTAPAVQALLDAGADLVGKSICDEMCYSLVGSNAHYGTPINPRAQERFTGGSSCGSAAAVAGNLVDFALGTDCGGSVRVPAAWCGLFGIRPTHDRVSPEMVSPLASSLDTVGWFARDARLFNQLGTVLLNDAAENFTPSKILVAEDMFDRLDASLAELLRPLATRIAETTGLTPEPVTVTDENLDDWFEVFRIVQAREIWTQHEEWVTRTKPKFGPGVAERMAAAPSITEELAAPAREKREKIRARMELLLEGNVVLCLPTATIPPMRSAPPEQLQTSRETNMALTSPSSLTGTPQIHLPLAEHRWCPVGLSLMAWRNRDEVLLDLAELAASNLN